MHTLAAERTQHLDALCADCLARTAASPHRSSQPGVQSVQALAVLRSHSSMEQLCHLCRVLEVLAAVCPTSVCSPGDPSSSSASCISHRVKSVSTLKLFLVEGKKFASGFFSLLLGFCRLLIGKNSQLLVSSSIRKVGYYWLLVVRISIRKVLWV